MEKQTAKHLNWKFEICMLFAAPGTAAGEQGHTKIFIIICLHLCQSKYFVFGSLQTSVYQGGIGKGADCSTQEGSEPLEYCCEPQKWSTSRTEIQGTSCL